MLNLTDKTIHIARTTAAHWCNAARRATAAAFMLRGAEEQALRDDGIAVLPNFLPDDEFRKVRDEAHRATALVESQIPFRQRREQGFGAQEPNAWGFDRYDGGTLNRFIDIDPASMPVIQTFAGNKRIRRMCRVGLGTRRPPRRSLIYLTVHGDEDDNHDIQKDMHRDSFYRKIKYWYFLDPVTENDGPFVYVPGSHKLTKQRAQWEAEQAQARGIPGLLLDQSFRISPPDLSGIGLPQPQSIPVAENTLVIADTFGFHRRGDAKPGSRRLAIYAQKRPWPFAPVGI